MTEQEAEFLKRIQAMASGGRVLHGVSSAIAREVGISIAKADYLRNVLGLEVVPGYSVLKNAKERRFAELVKRELVDGKLPYGTRNRLCREVGVHPFRAHQLLRLFEVEVSRTRPLKYAPNPVAPADELRMIEAAFAAVRS